MVAPGTMAARMGVEMSRIRRAEQRAAMAVNQALVALSWDIGKEILEGQARQGWGDKAIVCLA